ncbi:MAG: beta-propeller domain-containing protein [Campylobacterota bacterium]|nr:beta-propeller domain-containing protein [Campylobacterota bacterium]
MKIALLLLFSFYLLYSNTTIMFNKGWNLIGIPQTVSNMELFDSSDVELIWSYNAQQQKWEGYSPDSAINIKIVDKNISVLDSLEPHQGVWVFSKRAWDLELQDNNSTTDIFLNNKIVLKKGWNLLSLPNKTTLCKDFFGDASVWKYRDGWSTNDSSLNFPTIENIRESEGFWVKAQEDMSLDIGEESSKLHTFSSESQMLEYLRNMKKSKHYRDFSSEDRYHNDIIVYRDIEEPRDEEPTTSIIKDTTTNLTQAGVDESDVLKYNEQYIFSLDTQNEEIFISSFDNIVDKNYQAINTIDIANDTIIAFYLQNERVILFSQQDLLKKIKIVIYDISDIYNIKELHTYNIDGFYKDSRLVNGQLFVVSTFYPEIEYRYQKLYADGVCASLDRDEIYRYYSEDDVYMQGIDYDSYKENRCSLYNYANDGTIWRYDYENPIVVTENLTPNIYKNTRISKLISPSKLYAPKKLDQTATITTLSSLEIDKGEYKESISFIGYVGDYYISAHSLYIVSSSYPSYYDFFNFKEKEMIYKFSLGHQLSYKGKGSLDGRMLSELSMSEQDNYLRVATTEKNSIFTLKESDGALEVVGSLSGLGDESIRAVRFIDDRGFAISSKESDPFYMIDMSDPLNPQKVGELSISGDSNYLHLIDRERVLSIGRDSGLEIQLFDISDFSKPILADKMRVGSTVTTSSAEDNHKALFYRSSDFMFGMPYTDYLYTEDTTTAVESFIIYQVDEMEIKEIKSATQVFHEKHYDVRDKRVIIFERGETTYGTLFEGSKILSDIIINN